MSSRRSAIQSFLAVPCRKIFTSGIIQAPAPDGEAANASYPVLQKAHVVLRADALRSERPQTAPHPRRVVSNSNMRRADQFQFHNLELRRRRNRITQENNV